MTFVCFEVLCTQEGMQVSSTSLACCARMRTAASSGPGVFSHRRPPCSHFAGSELASRKRTSFARHRAARQVGTCRVYILQIRLRGLSGLGEMWGNLEECLLGAPWTFQCNVVPSGAVVVFRI